MCLWGRALCDWQGRYMPTSFPVGDGIVLLALDISRQSLKALANLRTAFSSKVQGLVDALNYLLCNHWLDNAAEVWRGSTINQQNCALKAWAIVSHSQDMLFFIFLRRKHFRVPLWFELFEVDFAFWKLSCDYIFCCTLFLLFQLYFVKLINAVSCLFLSWIE